MRLHLGAMAGAATALLVSCASAEARDMSRHPRAAPPAAAASRFYPQEIEGGVKGNLPFNNQIRKLRDPLNANGGR